MSGRRTLLCSRLAWVTCIIYGMISAYCTWRTLGDVVIYHSISFFFPCFKNRDTGDNRRADFQIFLTTAEYRGSGENCDPCLFPLPNSSLFLKKKYSFVKQIQRFNMHSSNCLSLLAYNKKINPSPQEIKQILRD